MSAWLLRLLCLLLTLGASGQACAGYVPGVQAEYWNWSGSGTPTIPSTTATLTQLEDQINVVQSTAAPATGITAANHMVRYSGYIAVASANYYQFVAVTDDGTRLWVDCDENGSFGTALIDKWYDQNTTRWTAMTVCYLVPGHYYRFRYETYNRAAEYSAQIGWSWWTLFGYSTPVLIPKGSGGVGLYAVGDSTPPTVSAADIACGGATSVTLSFSEALDSDSVTATGFQVNGVAPLSAELSTDGKSVVLTTLLGISTGQVVKVNPTLTSLIGITRVTDVAGNAVATGTSITVTGGTGTLTQGVLGTYYDQNNTAGNYLSGGSAARADSTIDFNWASGSPGVGTAGTDRFSVRWTGYIKIPSSGSYTFQTVSDDGVRLTIDGSSVIDNWTDHGTATDTSASLTLTGGRYVPFTMDYYENGGLSVIQLLWKKPSDSSYTVIPASQLYRCSLPLAGFRVSPGSSTASTCSNADVTVTALDSAGLTYTSYLGTVSLSTSTGRGNWSAGSPASSSLLLDAVANDGAATQVFGTLDQGVVRLKLATPLAGSLTVTASDPLIPGATGTSSAITFSDNAFTFYQPGTSTPIDTTVVAGRPHAMDLALVSKDSSNPSGCSVVTSYTGAKSLKLWRTDNSAPAAGWTAPGVSTLLASTPTPLAGTTVLAAVPGSAPATANATVTFVAGRASLALTSTDIGRYSLSALDSNFSSATGTSSTLTVRPFAIAVTDIRQGSSLNLSALDLTLGAFAKAGEDFSATVGAYRWSAAADLDNNGLPDATATLATLQAAGRTASFASAVTLSPLAGSQQPSTGVLGTLSNNTLAASAFSGGQATATTLRYSEVGSFALATSGVVSNFLGSGLNLDATVFSAAGVVNARVGRLRPSGFVVSSASITHRSGAACSPASTFTYLGENLLLNFTLTAKNGEGNTTANYTGSYARLDLTTALTWNLAGVDGSNSFSASGTGARLSLASSSGSWSQGTTSTIALPLQLSRATTVGGPYSLRLGIAPVDLDGTAMSSFDLDADPLVAGNDHSSVATAALRQGRLQILNAIGPNDRDLPVPVTTQYWNGSAWAVNTLDSCTSLPKAALAFANTRKSLTLADLSARSASVTLKNGRASLWMSKPGGGRRGSADLTLALGSTALSSSCLIGGVTSLLNTPSLGASLAHLRGDWCGSGSDRDPLARITFGLFRGADNSLDLRENF